MIDQDSHMWTQYLKDASEADMSHSEIFCYCPGCLEDHQRRTEYHLYLLPHGLWCIVDLEQQLVF
jgi:hypothetical protein